MSVNEEIPYKISITNQNRAGEVEWPDLGALSKVKDQSYTTVFQILNDIIDKALDTVLKKNKEEFFVNNKINLNVVNTIISNIYSEISRNKYSDRINETDLLDDEIKKLINEMKYPPKATNDLLSRVGVQKHNNDNQLSHLEPKRFEIEKKTGLINLVKNSKQFLSKFILNENIKPANIETNNKPETLLNIIELDCVGDKDSSYVATSKNLPPAPCQINDNAQMPNINLMDVIELISIPEDEINTVDESTAITEGSEKDPGTSQEQVKKKKKKYNFGLKFFKFMRKPSKKNQNTSNLIQDQ